MVQFLNSAQAKADAAQAATDEKDEQIAVLQAVNAQLRMQYQAAREVLGEAFNLVQALKIENATLRLEAARRQNASEGDNDSADGE